MAYTTTSNIYNTTSITSSEVDSTTLAGYIKDAVGKINNEINSIVVREPITYIDPVRENLINGSNKVFYARRYRGKYFGDMNDDQEITVSDIIVYKVDSSDNETKPTISSIDYDDMSFVLETAPSSTDKLFITYAYTYFDVVLPDKLIEMATRFLTASYAYLETEYALGTNVKVGNLSLSGLDKNSGALKYNNKYEEIINKIKSFGNSKNTPIKHNITMTAKTIYSDGPFHQGFIGYRDRY